AGIEERRRDEPEPDCAGRHRARSEERDRPGGAPVERKDARGAERGGRGAESEGEPEEERSSRLRERQDLGNEGCRTREEQQAGPRRACDGAGGDQRRRGERLEGECSAGPVREALLGSG